MNQTIYALFDFNEYTEVCKVTNFGMMTRTDSIFGFDIFPRIRFELFDTERHFTFFTVKSQDNGFYLIAYFHEVLCTTQVLRPRHFGNVDKTFDTRSYFDECAVVGHYDNFTFHFVTHFQIGIQSIPWMGLQLFQAQRNAFFLIIEIEDNYIEFLIERNYFFGVRYTSPRKVGDVNQSIYAAQIDEYTIGSDILDSSFEYLSFFEFGDNFFLLLFELGFDKSFVRNNHILEFLIDFNNFEFHSFTYEYIVVTDRLNVDLRTGQECFDTEYIDNHTALRATFDISFDDFVVFKSRVNTVPRAGSASFLVRQNQLSFFIFLILDINLYFISYFQIGIVAEFAHRNDTVRFVTDVYDHFTFVQCDYRTFDYFFVFYRIQRLVISIYQFIMALITIHFAFFKGIPVKIFYRAVF